MEKNGKIKEPFRLRFLLMSRSKLFIGSIAFVTLFLFYLSLFLVNGSTNAFAVVGGVAGLISTLIVVTAYIADRKSSMGNRTLFWRAMCDFGVAIRFLLMPAFNIYTCGSAVCHQDHDRDELNCLLPSATLQFFIIASEAWFFCHGLDLYYTINNPFSTAESRLWTYHIFTWSFATFITIFPWISDTLRTVYGYWYISNSNSDSLAICWIKIQAPTYLGWPIFTLFFMPLMCVYLFCSLMVVMAYFRLRKGLNKSFLPRVKLLVTSITNIVVLMLFWGTAMLIYFLTYELRNNEGVSNGTFNVLLFMIASKAFSSLVVWINQTNYVKKDDDAHADEDIDANEALREEVLSFATAGIRNTALSEATKELTTFTRRPRLANYKTNTVVTPWFFFRLVFDHDGEGLRAIKGIMEQNKRTMSGMPEEEARALLLNQNSLEDGTRLSQRQTMASVSNPMTSNAPANRLSSVDSLHSGNSGTGVREHHAHSEISEGPVSESHIFIKNSDMIDVDAMRSQSGERRTFSNRIYTHIWQPIVDFFENDKVEFKELQPYYFQQVRKAFGVTKDMYSAEFSKSIKQRMTEGGASGAFFFFSLTDKFVAKSCTDDEMDVLVQNAAGYASYMTSNPNTFICKIFGAYELRIYNEVLYFFVMNNLFLNSEGLTMNEKYDLKGSWVARNSAPPRDGQVFSCTYCERKFVYRKKRRPKRVQHHSMRIPSLNSDTADDSAHSPHSSSSPKTTGASSPLGGLLPSFLANIVQPSSNSNSQDHANSLGHNSTALRTSNTGAGGVASMDGTSSSLSTKGAAAQEADAVEMHEYSVDAGMLEDAMNSKCPVTVGEHSPNVIMKDNDIKHKIRLTEAESIEVQAQLRNDAEFLTSLGIMDYSLLVGVHIAEYEVHDQPSSPHSPAREMPQNSTHSATGTDSESLRPQQRSFMVRRASNMSRRLLDSASMPFSGQEEKGPELISTNPVQIDGAARMSMSSLGSHPQSLDTASVATADCNMGTYKPTRKLAVHKIIGPDAYFMGIIDFQQRWNFKKRMERFFKITFRRADPEGLSAIEPIKYKERFLRKIEDVLEQETQVRMGK